MQRNGTQGDRDRRGTAERGATQPMAGQPRAESDDDELQEPGTVPSFLTARELQARDPGKPPEDDDEAGERHASAPFTGSRGEPTIDDDEPPRDDQGEPEDRSERMPKKGRGKTK